MDTSISQGLTISGLGLFITFTALGFFILIMVVLKKLFPYKEEAEETEEGSVEVSPVAGMVESGGDAGDTGEIAAIAAAIAYLRGRAQAQLGSNLESGRGAWWIVNRIAARQAANLLKK